MIIIYGREYNLKLNKKLINQRVVNALLSFLMERN